jgi:hypothetical protein
LPFLDDVEAVSDVALADNVIVRFKGAALESPSELSNLLIGQGIEERTFLQKFTTMNHFR